MFIPNTTGVLAALTGNSIDGSPTFGTPATVRCGLVRLAEADEKTSVRTDSSASRGAAEEKIIKRGKVLFPASVTVAHGAKFTIYGVIMRVVSVEPRIAITGELDHHECDLEIWS